MCVSLLGGNSLRVVLQYSVQMIIMSLKPSLFLCSRFLPLLNGCLQQPITNHVNLTATVTPTQICMNQPIRSEFVFVYLHVCEKQNVRFSLVLSPAWTIFPVSSGTLQSFPHLRNQQEHCATAFGTLENEWHWHYKRSSTYITRTLLILCNNDHHTPSSTTNWQCLSL